MKGTMKTLILGLVLLLAACSTGNPLVVSGEVLKATGTEFVATSTAFTNACVAKTLSVKQCDTYRTFERKFKLSFPAAVKVQETAMTFGDQTMAQNASTIIAGLASELANFTALIKGTK